RAGKPRRTLADRSEMAARRTSAALRAPYRAVRRTPAPPRSPREAPPAPAGTRPVHDEAPEGAWESAISRDARTNRRIRAREVRVIGAEGEQLGILPIDAALARAQELGLDLVEVSPMAK